MQSAIECLLLCGPQTWYGTIQPAAWCRSADADHEMKVLVSALKFKMMNVMCQQLRILRLVWFTKFMRNPIVILGPKSFCLWILEVNQKAMKLRFHGWSICRSDTASFFGPFWVQHTDTDVSHESLIIFLSDSKGTQKWCRSLENDFPRSFCFKP